jgi:hypothetical protein
MELKGMTFNIKLRFIQSMGRYDRWTNVCQAIVTDPMPHDHDHHLPDGAGTLLHLNTSHIIDQVEGICASSRQSHTQYTPGSQSWPHQPTWHNRQQNLGKSQKARIHFS